MPFTTPLALLGLLFIPAVVAMYLLKLRRDETVVPSTLLWTRLVADVEANAPWQKLRRSLLLLLQLLLVVILALLAARPFLERPAGLARDVVLVIDTSASMAATDVAAEPARRRPRRPRSTPCGTCRPAARSASSPRTGAPGSWSTRRPTSGASARRSTASQPTSAPRRPRRRPGARRQARRPLGRRPDPGRHRRRARDAAPTAHGPAPRSRSCRSAASARTRRSSRWPSGRRRRRSPARSSSASPTSTSSGPRGASRSGATAACIEVRDLLLDAQARSDVVIDDVPRDVGTLEVRLVGPDPAVDGARRTSWPSTTTRGRSSRPTGRG